MAGSTTIRILDKASPKVRAVLEMIRNGTLHRGIGRAAQNEVKRQLIDYNAKHPNQLGGPRQNFFSKAAQQTTFDVGLDSVTVSINKQGFRLQYEGGTVTARDKKLTIPARSEAYGRRAGEFNNLRLQVFAGGTAALVEADRTDFSRSKKGKLKTSSAGGLVMFWLKDSVTIRPHPEILDMREIERAGLQGAEEVAELHELRGGAK
jgi:hypothetical protein